MKSHRDKKIYIYAAMDMQYTESSRYLNFIITNLISITRVLRYDPPLGIKLYSTMQHKIFIAVACNLFIQLNLKLVHFNRKKCVTFLFKTEYRYIN